MRVLVLTAILVGGCAAPPPAALETDAPPPPEASGAAAGLPALCADVPHQPLPSTRQNYSLAAEFYRNASAGQTDADRREVWCAAAVYLRWLTDSAPLYTGREPDDRSFLRLAAAYEYFADADAPNRRTHLDSALALRARGLALMRRDGLRVDDARRALARGRFYFTHGGAFDDAASLEAAAYADAIAAAPDSVPDWYLQRLVVLTADTVPDPAARADLIASLVPLADAPDLRDYLSALVDHWRRPPVATEPQPGEIGGLLAAYARGDYAGCEPRHDVARLVHTAARSPEIVVASGGEPDAIVDALLDCVTEDVDDPVTLFSLFSRSWRRGDTDRAESYYQRALRESGSDRERSRFVTARAARGWGNARALYGEAARLDPLNARARYALVRLDADLIGAPRTLPQRAVYWCLADRLDEIVALGDPDVGPLARRTRDAYLRSAPARDEWFFSYSAGDPVRARSGGYSCTAQVR